MPPQKTNTLTIKANGILNVLKTEAAICPAFDPQKTKDRPPQKKFKAIWDTGATGSAVTKNVADKCGLRPIRMVEAHTAAGKHKTNVYLVNIGLPNKVAFMGWPVTEVELIGDADVLIGMDIINKGDFAVTNKDGKTTFTYRCPSVEEIDFVAQKQAIATGKVGRNQPCPCGSGKKYKKCCGK